MRRGALATVLLLSAGAATAQIGIGEEGSVPELPSPEADPRDTVTLARGLDKVTARIVELELPEDKPVRFGSLVITSRHCQSRPPEEPPETFAFLEIEDVQDAEPTDIFTGWMIASSPALHALEHPVYDIWVVGCRREALPPLPADAGL